MRSYAKYCSVKAFLCQWKLPYVVPMIRLKHKVPPSRHYIMKIRKCGQDKIFGRAVSHFGMLWADSQSLPQRLI